MVFELLGESLLHVVEAGGPLERASVVEVCRDVLEGLSFLHASESLEPRPYLYAHTRH